MIHKEFEPSPRIKNYVQLIWMMDGEAEAFPRERILPDGIVEVVFHYGTPLQTYSADGTVGIQPRSFAISQMREFIEIEPTGPFGFFSVRFFPWGAYHFMDYPIADFLDGTIEANRIWPEHPKELASLVEPGRPIDNRLTLLQEFLHARLDDHSKNDDDIDQVIRDVRDSRGQISIEEICARHSLSEKQLQRKFLSAVGTTPKVFMRVSRFLHLCHHLKDYQGKSLAELTYDFGYFDQAHFIKDFKQFSGFTPKQFFEQNNIGFADV